MLAQGTVSFYIYYYYWATVSVERDIRLFSISQTVLVSMPKAFNFSTGLESNPWYFSYGRRKFNEHKFVL